MKLPKSIFLTLFCVMFANLAQAQKISFELLDSVDMKMKPTSSVLQHAKTVYISQLVPADSVYTQVIAKSLDLSHYTIVRERSSADFVLTFQQSISNVSNGSQNRVNPTIAGDKRYVPTSGETNLNHNFDPNKTAAQNSKSKYTKRPSGTNSHSGAKSYMHSELLKYVTIIELYDREGRKMDESKVEEEITITGYSTISINTAKKDFENTKEITTSSLYKNHLLLAMNYVNNNYLFSKSSVPVYMIKVKHRDFNDWNDAVEVLKSIIQNPNESDESRKNILRSVLEKQANADFTKAKDGELLHSAALHNLAVFQFYAHNQIEAGALLTQAQAHLVYSNHDQRFFYERLMIYLLRGI